MCQELFQAFQILFKRSNEIKVPLAIIVIEFSGQPYQVGIIIPNLR